MTTAATYLLIVQPHLTDDQNWIEHMFGDGLVETTFSDRAIAIDAAQRVQEQGGATVELWQQGGGLLFRSGSGLLVA